jgi:transcriptional regulator with GAF, ATPase, and Fis domain
MELVGKSQKMLQVFQLVSQVAPSRSTILVSGESGTGKELVAKAVHQNSPRRDKPFVVVNSGSLPHELLESNLFGHVKGAFTGAVYAKKGLFELADKGTLFFDEIGNIPMETQAKLLRVIQEREFMRLGGIETVKVDVRVVAATNVDLRRAVEEGRFREDLYYRLNVIAIQLPPLRQRKEDIPALAQHFVDKYSQENGKPVQGVTPEALQVLMDYDWPGNVRELENVIERGVVLSTGSSIGPELVPEQVRTSPGFFHIPPVSVPPEGINLREVIAGFERRIIESTLDATGGVQKDAARLLGLKPTTLNEMIKRHGIPLPRDRERRSGLVPRAESPLAKSD